MSPAPVPSPTPPPPGPTAPRPHTRQPRFRALLVGVSNYSDPDLQDLRGPAKDVPALSEALDGVLAPGPHHWQLDTFKDPDQTTLVNALVSLFGESGEQDTTLFYYSGHGVVKDGMSYICAANTKKAIPSVYGISAQQIVELVKTADKARTIIILDCCHAAPLGTNPFNDIADETAVVLASHGPVDDAASDGALSPFTGNLVEVLSDASAYEGGYLHIGGLRRALTRRGVLAHSDERPSDRIRLAMRHGEPEAVAEPGPSLAISPIPIDDEPRLRLVRQLATVIDGLLSVAQDSAHFPDAVVNDGIQVLAEELRCFFSEDQLRQLDELHLDGGSRMPSCAVQFTGTEARKLHDLPWEYLALHNAPGDDPEERSGSRVAIERVIRATGTKAASGQVERVAMFSSFRSPVAGQKHPLAAATTDRLGGLVTCATQCLEATWEQFYGDPDNADVVVLQTPVGWKEHKAHMMFATGPNAPTDAMSPKGTKLLLTVLRGRKALSRLFIETVADISCATPALAARTLAVELARELNRPVVAVCHAQAYLESVKEIPTAQTFLPALIAGLNNGAPLNEAALTARDEVMSALGMDESAIVGVPIVVRPEDLGSDDDQSMKPRSGSSPGPAQPLPKGLAL